MRAFLAVEMDDVARDALTGLLTRLRASTAKVSWVKPENVHLTLRFLGDVDEGQVNRLGERLALAYRDVEPFRLMVRGVGVFPNLRRPRVVWAGVLAGDGVLEAVQRASEDAARWIGLPPEEKRFSPHVTLGRVRDDRRCGDLRDCVEAEQGFGAGDIVVKRVALFRSTLSSQGSNYTLLREFPFQ